MGYVLDWFDIEESPDTATRLNAIIDFWEEPCNAPLTVYLETLVPVAGRLVLYLVDFDLGDLLRSCLRPSCSLRRNRTGRRSRGRRRGGGIPETSDLICRRIPGRGFFAGQNVGGGTKWLWRIDGVIQRGLWYWLVADLAIEGFYWWATLIRRSEYCNHSAGLVAMQKWQSLNPTFPFDAWLVSGIYEPVWNYSPATTTPAGFFLPSGVWSLIASETWYDVEFHQNQTAQLGWSSPSGITGGGVVSIPQNGQATGSVEATIHAPADVTLVRKSTGGAYGKVNGLMMARKIA